MRHPPHWTQRTTAPFWSGRKKDTHHHALEYRRRVTMPAVRLQASQSKLGLRMKALETADFQPLVDPTLPFITRLDGHRFSKFSSAFTKPCDSIIHQAMLRASADLLTTFLPMSVYTESDEISLVFSAVEPLVPGAGLPFSGKTAKILSLAAGYCSARFNFHLRAQVNSSTPTQAATAMEGGQAHFDARLFSLPDGSECLNNIRWRMSDCKRNSISLAARAHFSAKELHQLNGEQMIQKLKEKGITFTDLPDWFRFGVVLKKKSVTRTTVHPITGEEVTADRTEVAYTCASVLDHMTVPEGADFLLTKVVQPSHPYYTNMHNVHSPLDQPEGL